MAHGDDVEASLLRDPVGRGYDWGGRWPTVPASAPRPARRWHELIHRLLRRGGDASARNRLEAFFDAHATGPGIWKWRHYFEIYDRHFRQFRNTEVHILEIGVYSGGSFEMWRDYFGPKARLYGVDIAPECKVYEGGPVKIFIGDQADRGFWRDFRDQVPVLDIVIDDGGHLPVQQVVSLEELLPHLRPGGVYLCEDIAWDGMHGFASYVHGLAHRLNNSAALVENEGDAERRLVCSPTPVQQAVAAVHLYPFVTVIERGRTAPTEFVAPKHGSQWQPFLR